MGTRTRVGSAVLLAVSALSGIFAVGALGDAATPHDDRVLIATFGAGMGGFGVVLALLAGREPRAWWALWYLPVFLALHVVLLGTWLPDGVLLLLVSGALLVLSPRTVSSPVTSPAG